MHWCLSVLKHHGSTVQHKLSHQYQRCNISIYKIHIQEILNYGAYCVSKCVLLYVCNK